MSVEEGSLLHKLEQCIAKASSPEECSTALERWPEMWEKCSEIGSMGFTPLQDAEEDVEAHFVCFARLRGNLGIFDGDRTSGPEDLNIKLEPRGLVPDQALRAVERHLGVYGNKERRDYSALLALVNTAI